MVSPGAGRAGHRRWHHGRRLLAPAAGRRRPRRNRAIGKLRAPVERTFAVLKRWYGYRRVRYRSLVRNGLQLQPLALAVNLRRAVILRA